VLTSASLLIRLNAPGVAARELAWQEFRDRYAPIIAGFARNLGAARQDIDDLIQEVIAGFYSVSPRFVYQPGKGRFRGYLKTCTAHALSKLRRERQREHAGSLEDVDPESVQVAQAWDRAWDHEVLHQVLAEAREVWGSSKTFQAFERYSILNEPAEKVGESLQMNVNSVHQAKTRMVKMLKEMRMRLDAELDGGEPA
jgi:RNA polymerase sigma factor (sigma-70 family)